MAWGAGRRVRTVGLAMLLTDTPDTRRVPYLRAPVESHTFAMPLVREIERAPVRRRPSQRDLVVASLVLCDRRDSAPYRRGS
jgi:hypothetical protein